MFSREKKEEVRRFFYASPQAIAINLFLTQFNPICSDIRQDRANRQKVHFMNYVPG